MKKISNFGYFKKLKNQITVKQEHLSFLVNKPKMAQFLKFKFLISLKLNFIGGQFYQKYQKVVISKSGTKSS